MTRRPFVATALAAVLATTAACTSEQPKGGGDEFRAVQMPLLQIPEPEPEPEKPAPEADVSRTMFASATLQTFEPPLDACSGPVAIDVGEDGRPLLVSEHDYCGGAAWIPGLGEGDVVELDGPGVDAGLYEVQVVDTHQRRNVYIKDLRPEMDVVLQTCISSSQLILVGLTKVPDSSV